MVENLQANLSVTADYLIHNRSQIARSIEELSSAKEILQPGDDVTNYERVQHYSFEKITEQAQLKAIQTRLNWYATSIADIQQLISSLSSMSTTSMNAKSSIGTADYLDTLDADFQKMKLQIANQVDGLSGQIEPGNTFGSTPLFLGYEPNGSLNEQFTSPYGESYKGLSLYTSYAAPAFTNLPYNYNQTPASLPTEGTSQNSTSNHVTLFLEKKDAASLHAYDGLQIKIVSADGSSTQTLKIPYAQKDKNIGYLPEQNAITFSEFITPDLLGASYSIYQADLPQERGVELTQSGVDEGSSQSFTQLILDKSASSLSEAYQGLSIDIISADQTEGTTLTIPLNNEETGLGYNPITRTITFSNPTDFDLQGASYTIRSGITNSQIGVLPNTQASRFASYIWGADNGSAEWLNPTVNTFIDYTGTNQSAETSFTQIKLDNQAAIDAEAYTGLKIYIESVDGEQFTTLSIPPNTTDGVGYDPQTRTLTFAAPLPFELAGCSYNINGTVNRQQSIFTPLTKQEEIYRFENNISSSELEPQTYEEKVARQQLNIFNPEYGNLLNSENATRMYQQVNNAINQLSLLITRYESKSAVLNGNYKALQRMSDYNQEGMSALASVDFTQESIRLQDLNMAYQRIVDVAQRMNENFRKLTELVKP